MQYEPDWLPRARELAPTHNYPQIARIVGVHPDTVRYWINPDRRCHQRAKSSRRWRNRTENPPRDERRKYLRRKCRVVFVEMGGTDPAVLDKLYRDAGVANYPLGNPQSSHPLKIQ